MSALSVHLGEAARGAFCDAFDRARTSIDAEFYSIGDPDVIASLNRAAARGVRVRVTLEGDTHRYRGPRAVEPSDDAIRGGLASAIDVVVSRRPSALVHGKAAVVDGADAIVATANPTRTGFAAPGELAIEDRSAADAAAVLREIDAASAGSPVRSRLRDELRGLFASSHDLSIESEDLSDWRTAASLAHRARAGRRDRVLVGPAASRCEATRLRRLAADGVDVRIASARYMHGKLVDAGDRIYVGSANLTRNGIDESYEVGLVANAADFADHAASVRADFERTWAQARSLRA